jgi:hypothetical protein
MPLLGPMGARRFGRPGLLGTIGRTAVIAGTATMTSQAIRHHQQQRATEHAAYVDQQQSAPAADPQPDLVDRLSELAQLRSSGALTESEFDAAKAQMLR